MTPTATQEDDSASVQLNAVKTADSADNNGLSGVENKEPTPAEKVLAKTKETLERLRTVRDRIRWTLGAISAAFRKPIALGTTQSGQPRHPLFMPKTAVPAEWRLP